MEVHAVTVSGFTEEIKEKLDSSHLFNFMDAEV